MESPPTISYEDERSPEERSKTSGTVTRLLHQARDGRPRALDELFDLVYQDLRKMATNRVAAMAGTRSIEPTALVNAACLRLMDKDRLDAEDRRHFYFLLGRAMHDVLVEHARSQSAAKRGGGRARVTLRDLPGRDEAGSQIEIMDLHEALEVLKKQDAQGAQIILLRFFGGLTIQEAAEVMGCTFAVARGHWESARAWLAQRLALASRERDGSPAAENES